MIARAAMLGAAGLITASCGDVRDPAPAAAPNSLAPAIVAAEATAPPSSTTGRSSQFTKLTESTCKLVETIEETGDWVRSCQGVGGHAVEWSSGDLRENLVVSKDGRKSSLEIPALVANGAFDRLGETVEWRGPGGSEPDVLVVRVHVAGPDGRDDSGRLAIARLSPSPCLVAIVPPGPEQSDRARTIADRPLPDCLPNRAE